MSDLPWPDGHPRRRRILLVLCLSLLAVVVDNTILNTALPTLALDLHATTTDLQWIIDAYTLVFAALLIAAGSLADRYGRREALLAGLVVFGLGSALAAVSSSAGELIAARAVMGLGAAFVMPATLSILTAVFPERERAAAIGAWSGVAGVGIVLGPTLGGFLLNHFDWGSVFWVNVPLVAVAVGLVLTVVPHVPGRRAGTRLDVLGAVLSAAAMLAVVDAVIQGPDRGWTSAPTLLEGALGLLLAGAFVVRELRVANPLIDVRVFGHRAFSAATTAVAITAFSLFGSLFALTQYLQLVLGYTPFGAGVRAMPFALAVIVVAPLSAPLAGRIGVRAVVPAGLALMGASLFLLGRLEVDSAYGVIAFATALGGLGMGLAIAPAGESIMTVLPPAQAGAGSAVNSTMQELGGALGVAVLGSLVSAAYRASIDGSGLPAAVLRPARESIGAADAVARGAGDLGPSVADAAHSAFVSGLSVGCTVGAVAAFAGAVLCAAALPPRVRPRPAPVAPVREAALAG